MKCSTAKRPSLDWAMLSKRLDSGNCRDGRAASAGMTVSTGSSGFCPGWGATPCDSTSSSASCGARPARGSAATGRLPTATRRACRLAAAGSITKALARWEST